MQRTKLPFCMFLLVLLTLSSCGSGVGVFGGGSWQKSGLQDQHIQTLAVNPTHLRDIYAGDTQNGIFASTDAGNTWKESSVGLPLPISVSALSFDSSGKKLYAATSAGLFVSADAAAHWSMTEGLPADSYTTLAFDVNASQVVYTGSAHSGVLKSTDSGTHWTRINNGLPAGALISLLYDPNLKQLWAAFANTLYRSDNQGASWHNMSNGLPADVGINALAQGEIPSTSSSLLFVGTNHGFFLSRDEGQNWVPSQLQLGGLRISAIQSDAIQPNVIYIATDLGVLKSTDNGQNWDQFASGLPTNQPVHSVVQGGDNNSQLFVASQGIYFYPGSGNLANPSQFLSIILVLVFFALLYWFFGIRRQRRLAAWRARNAGQAEAQNATPGEEENSVPKE